MFAIMIDTKFGKYPYMHRDILKYQSEDDAKKALEELLREGNKILKYNPRVEHYTK